MVRKDNEHRAGEVGLRKPFTSGCVIGKDSLKEKPIEWMTGELNMRQRETNYEGQSSGRDEKEEMERGQQSE